MPDQVEDNLFIGDLNDASNLYKSNLLNIKCVYSIGIFPTLVKSSTFEYDQIEVADLPSEDLLSHFNVSFEHIRQCVGTRRPILVHCFHGVSRSATIVIAYLMRAYDLPLRIALDKLRTVRSMVDPNDGFMNQLKLYERMNKSLDVSYAPYKLYRLNKVSKIVRDVRLVPTAFRDLIQSDPGLDRQKPNPNVYKCKKCRRVLFNTNNVFEHRPGEPVSWRSSIYSNENDKIDVSPSTNDGNLCKSKLFIEPLAWMKNVESRPSGKLVCPRCNFKLGSYSWIEYCVCACATKIFPFFYVTPSRIDFDIVVKNVQVTI